MDWSPDDTADETCRILLKISREQMKRDDFLLEMVSHVGNWPGVEFLSIEFGLGDEADSGPLNSFN